MFVIMLIANILFSQNVTIKATLLNNTAAKVELLFHETELLSRPVHEFLRKIKEKPSDPPRLRIFMMKLRHLLRHPKDLLLIPAKERCEIEIIGP